MKVFRIVGYGLVIIFFNLHSGCAPVKPPFTFQEPSFSLDSLQNEPCVLMSAPAYVSLYDFQNTFENVYHTNEIFMAKIVDSLSSGLRRNGWNVVSDNSSGIYDRFLNDSGKYNSSNNAKYVLCIRSVAIGKILTQHVPVPARSLEVYSSNNACNVSIEVVIMQIEPKKLVLSFSRGGGAPVNFYAKEAALQKAVGRARESLERVLLNGK